MAGVCVRVTFIKGFAIRNRYIGFRFQGCLAACQGEGAASNRLLRRSIITHVSCQVNGMAASGCKSMLRKRKRSHIVGVCAGGWN